VGLYAIDAASDAAKFGMGAGLLQTIVLASRKGGAGKTTLAAHIAVSADRAGAGPVAIIDTDDMRGLTRWYDARKSDTPVCVELKGGIAKTLAQLKANGFKTVVVDTPPAATNDVASTIAQATLVIVPVIPSPHDLGAIGETLDLVEQQDKPLLFVINNASTNGRLTMQAAAALSQHGTIAATGGEPVVIRTRQDWRSSMVDGRTVLEIKNPGKSGAEINALWDAVTDRLQKESRRGRRHSAA
jgi:chromosome partitioning protein